MSATTSSTISVRNRGMIIGVSGGGAVHAASRPSTSSSTSVSRSPLTPGSETPGQLYGSASAAASSYGSVVPQPSSGAAGAGKLVTVSVVGWSGTEKGSAGVGKSCLCNRFVRPLEDEYRTDHISTLSQVDFSGRVINNDHWLYWGERVLFMDDACEVTFRVLEQTEFVDDESFQPLKASSTSQRDPYVKRCAATRLQSADKLMYISKEQLGVEHEYEQRPLPDGKASIDGFLCVYDVGAGASPHQYHSSTSSSSSSADCRQMEFVSQILQNILKTRKPVVLVTSKHDEADDRLAREAERLLQSRKEFKNSIPLIETSSHKNVNVEAAFVLLASLIERQQKASSASPKVKTVSYSEAAKNRREILDVAAAAYVQKLRSTTRGDHRSTWTRISRQLATDPDFVHFCELCGTAAAQRLFKQHTGELRDKYAQRRLRSQIERLPDVMPLLLPDVDFVRGKNWQDILQDLSSLPHFNEYFQPLGASNDYSGDQEMDYSPSLEDPRIPAELLYTQEASGCFRRHVAILEGEHRRQRLQDDFGQLIAGCSQVTPGKPLSDVRIFFLGKECFESLSEADLQTIYDRYQNQLVQRARRDLVELLMEQVDEFVNRALLRAKMKSAPSAASGSKQQQQQHQQPSGGIGTVVGPPRTSAPPLPGMNERDWRELHEKLQEDARYRQLNRLHQLRDSLISQYISFVSHPLRQHCPAYPRCMDALVAQFLANHSHRPLPQNRHHDEDASSRRSLESNARSVQRGHEHFLYPLPSERRMTVLVLGADGLAEQVIRELRAFLQNDLFVHRGSAYKFDFRSIESEDGWPAPNFQPNGLICALSSRASLDYVRNNINRTLLARNNDESASVDDSLAPPSLRGLPVVLIFAFDPSNLDDLPYLQQQGGQLADQWQCSFIGLEPSDRNIGHVTQDRRVAAQVSSMSLTLFTVEQVKRALACLLMKAVEESLSRAARGKEEASSSSSSLQTPEPGWRPDASLMVCLMCGDDYAPELILGPLLNYQCSLRAPANQAPSSARRANVAAGGREPGGFGDAVGDDTALTTFYVETFSPGCGQQLRHEINVASYHNAFVRISEQCYSHGYILVYTAKRRASLAHLHLLARLIPDPIPILVVAVGEVTEFFSDPATNSMITEGNDIADRMGARFITISKVVEQQVGIYTPFLDEVCAKVVAVESAGFVRRTSENEPRSGHYAPLSDFTSGFTDAHQSPKENQWYGDVGTTPFGGVRSPPQQHRYNQSNGVCANIRPPPPPYSAATLTAAASSVGQSAIPSAMSRSIYYDGAAPSSSQGQHRGGYGSPQTASQQQSAMYAKGRLSESCLSVTAYTDHSSTPSPSSATASARCFDDAPSATAQRGKLSDSGSEGWWDGGSDGTLNKDASRQSASVKGASSKPAPAEKLQRSGSAASSSSPRGGASNPGGGSSPASSKKRSSNNREAAAAAAAAGSHNQQQKKLGRINLDSISSKITGKKTSDRVATATASPRVASSRQLKQQEASTAPLATPESIELGAEYMTVKDALGGSPWPSSHGATGAVEYYGDDEQQYATVDSILGANDGEFPDSSAPPRPPRRSDSSGGAETTSSGDSSSAQSYEKSAYDRAGRKPTPHRSRNGRRGPRSTSSGELTTGVAGLSIAERVRQLNAALEAGRSASPPVPPVPPYSNERLVTVTKRSGAGSVWATRRSASEESLLDPFLHHRQQHWPSVFESRTNRGLLFDDQDDGDQCENGLFDGEDASSRRVAATTPSSTRKPFAPSGGRVRRAKTATISETAAATPVASGGGFVRKMATSFRFRRKKSSDTVESRSTPQSPLLGGGGVAGGGDGWAAESSRVFVLPPFETSFMWSSNADGGDETDGQAASSSAASRWSGTKGAHAVTTRSPKKESVAVPPEKVGRDRKISKEAKKSVGDGPARVTGKKKSREAGQTQLVPPDATLSDLAASDDDPVPTYVQKCVEFVEATGLQVEGIYRVPGNQAHVILLEQKFIDDPNVSFYDLDLPVNAVATSLKNFFSSLSEPVVPYNLYDDLMDAMSIRQSDARQDRVQQVLQRLPTANRAVLRYFVSHLRKVADHFETTAMDHRNLAKCWWPTLLRPQFDSFETMAQMTQRLEEFVQLLLEHPELLN